MAILLGLHQEVSDDSLDDQDREHRRRLWWSVYSLDRYLCDRNSQAFFCWQWRRILCVKSGNSLTIADEDIGVFPPSRLVCGSRSSRLTSLYLHPNKLQSDEPDLGPAAVLFHYTELSRILGRIMKSELHVNAGMRLDAKSTRRRISHTTHHRLQSRELGTVYPCRINPVAVKSTPDTTVRFYKSGCWNITPVCVDIFALLTVYQYDSSPLGLQCGSEMSSESRKDGRMAGLERRPATEHSISCGNVRRCSSE